MALYEWNENLSVNIKSIDAEHKMLFNMINEFYEEIHKIHEGLGSSTLKELRGTLIRKMKNYSIDHFRTEEEYFEQYNYPDFEAHKKEHYNFIDKVSDLEKRFKAGSLIMTTELTDFLKDWLVSHIQDSDQKYSDFLVGKGVN